MRVATQEEDELMRKISHLLDQNYLLENELISAESQIKGYKELRRQSTVKLVTVLCVCFFFFVGMLLYLLNLKNDPKLTIAIMLASGGFGVFAIGFFVYTIITVIKYFMKTSQSDFWINMSDKAGVENIYSGETANNTNIRSLKSTISQNTKKLDEILAEYFKLKEINDKQFEEDIASGKRKPDFNFEAYNSYIEIDNEWINFNKLKVRDIKLKSKKNSTEQDIDRLLTYENKCKESIRWFFLLLFIMIGMCILLVCAFIFETGELRGMISLAFGFSAFISGVVMLVNLINLIFKFPFISDSAFASYLADKFGFEETKKDLNRLVKELEETEKSIREVNVQLQEYRNKNLERN